MRPLLLILSFFVVFALSAQKREEFF